MSKLFKAVGYGLLVGGLVIVPLEYVGVSMTEGPGGFQDRLNPFTLRNYMTLLPLAPGAVLIWLSSARP
jgi:hypothetical protein